MITHDRASLRNFYLETLEKSKNNQILTGLEAQVESILKMHPEYLKAIEDPSILEKDFSVELGEINPFLHLSLHLGLREQLNTNRPQGIALVYQKLILKLKDPHEAEHRMMDILAEILWISQKYQTMPDERIYLEKLQAI